jgi:hypothetical protein
MDDQVAGAIQEREFPSARVRATGVFPRRDRDGGRIRQPHAVTKVGGATGAANRGALARGLNEPAR